MKLISIIIPVYNVEKYLKECIESTINQTYKNIEILLIDDGSTDKSGKICDKYASMYKNIKVIHQNNKGVSSARNKGLKIAKGDYIIFIDSDDYMNKNMIEILYNKAIITDCDIIICGYNKIEEKNNMIINESIPTKGYLNEKEYIHSIVEEESISGYLWNKLIKKDLINGLQFNEESKICEDLEFNLELLNNNCSAYCVDEALYNYRQRNNSILHSKKYTYASISSYPRIINILKKHDEKTYIYEYNYIIVSTQLLINKKLLSSNMYEKIKHQRKELIRNNNWFKLRYLKNNISILMWILFPHISLIIKKVR